MAPRVICLGEALIDRIFDRYDGDRPDQPFWADHPGGAPANGAVALAKLGTEVGFIGCLGTDAHGDLLATELMKAGVDCGGIQRASSPTRVVLVKRDRQGERAFVGFSQPDPATFADACLDATQLASDWFATADYLVMGTLGLAYPNLGESMRQALTWAQQYQITTVVDLNWRPGFWPQPEVAPPLIKAFINQVDVLKLNDTEAEWLFQTIDVRAIYQALGQAKIVLLTAGDSGCHYATAHSQGHVPAFPVDCEDTTGAGDSFLAGFVHQLCLHGVDLLNNSNQLKAALEYASAAGALTTTQPGAMAAQPNARAVEAFLYLHRR